MNNEQFFAQNASTPTAWSVGRGWYVRFSMSRDLFSRDEIEVKKLASKHGLKIKKEGGSVVFLKE